MRKKYVIASMEGLECPKRAKNVINRKIGTFYIETISQKIYQLRQKIFFRPRSFKKNWQKLKMIKIQSRIINDSRLDFDYFRLLSVYFLFFKDRARKNNFCRSWEFFFWHTFDVKNVIFRFMMFSARFEHSNPSIEAITYFSSSIFFFIPICNAPNEKHTLA